MKYLKSTLDIGLEYRRSREGLIGYVDSNYARDRDKRRPMTGYVFTLRGCIINWRASLQSTIALSTTEAEFMALAKGIKEAIWLNGLMTEIDQGQNPVDIYCDNQSVIHLLKDQMHHERTKHMGIKYNFICKAVAKKTIRVKKIHTSQNPVDMMTKLLTSTRFTILMNLVGLKMP